ncbi:Elongation factor Tu GTP binding domain [Geosmithia morbida]|uniref:Elongation factor Tu GTP binding domain n=1 Tax=Geosmithia morbida TaxID=1094350 RepID=A0A9P4YWI9_9HYPO|nr:Elongation factor Tu GTP binding domain [Geosmithia morbida]KAF4123340.1 Elongation factor Tu GTP binding domain [Geosmithia morbida]
MASIFTYDPDPPKVESPWLRPQDSGSKQTDHNAGAGSGSDLQISSLSDYSVHKLEAEPQSGPTEYKLHLLLRPRRAYRYMSTTTKTVGIQPSQTKDASGNAALVGAPGPSQPRQQRLLHLTTQLLWRLQQSSPYHASSSKEIPMPKLPDDSVIDLESAKEEFGGLVPGLEESRGALYEIGVFDDGTLVGLTKDEMDESLKTLRVMAASLGCSVQVLRMVIVGDCEWVEPTGCTDELDLTTSADATKEARLWVAEALVMPNLGSEDQRRGKKGSSGNSLAENSQSEAQTVLPSKGSSQTPQLRVTFTGPTTSGKSSLLGTLSTGTLDNGRGKSRLGLLKHRHEVMSGVTSSIAQELIGYRDLHILNFSQSNIESWTDIHDCAEGGRLVFVSDSGGHPRYRRTVLRGLMSWAPHWSVLCIAADDSDTGVRNPGETSTARDVLGEAAAGVDLVRAHLTLSLKLNVPLAVVITKLDLASKASLHKTMSKVLTAIKDAGRTPKIVQPDQKQPGLDLERIPRADHDKIQGTVQSMLDCGSLTQYVPIVLTSAVKGIGIGLVHALLEGLPLPPPPTSRDYVGMALNPEQPSSLFHIDDTFSLPASYRTLAAGPRQQADRGVVVSGHVRFGSLSIGDKIVVGPFPPSEDESRSFATEDKASPGNYGLSISHPFSSQLARVAMKNAVSASSTTGEWHRAQIASVRNLRLPVRTLEAGQAGSVGLVFESSGQGNEVANLGHAAPATPPPPAPRIRRGMVLAILSEHTASMGLSLQAASGFTAAFNNDPDIASLAPGSFVNVYVASVRAAARVMRITHPSQSGTMAHDVDSVFSLSEDMERHQGDVDTDQISGTQVSLELLHNREWVEMGSPVILLEGGSQDRSGLEGYVGRIIEIVD